MADHVAETLRLRIAELERKRKARAGKPGFEQNVQDIDAALSELKAALAERKA